MNSIGPLIFSMWIRSSWIASTLLAISSTLMGGLCRIRIGAVGAEFHAHCESICGLVKCDGQLSPCRSRRHRNSVPVHCLIASGAVSRRRAWRISMPSRRAGDGALGSRPQCIEAGNRSAQLRSRPAPDRRSPHSPSAICRGSDRSPHPNAIASRAPVGPAGRRSCRPQHRHSSVGGFGVRAAREGSHGH